jgi:L-ribulokinase
MFTIGFDHGANSVRALVARCADGAEFGSAVVGCPSGDEGVLLDASDHHLARQALAGLPGDLQLPIGARRAVR